MCRVLKLFNKIKIDKLIKNYKNKLINKRLNYLDKIIIVKK